MNDLANSNSIDKDDMINSLHDLINGSETIHPTNLNYQHSQSHDSLNSWDPEDLEGQLQHTRSVLRETEQTNAKLEAQVDLLKKELRRNESNSQSLQHINQNMSYFKNVMMKFLAPDEKVRDSRIQMLPVLGTMLALSSEEIKTIENALKAQDQERLAASSEIAGYFGPLSGIF
jgi:translation initiation factor 2B subunit (eIF-2B alpha/beta/delta family)